MKKACWLLILVFLASIGIGQTTLVNFNGSSWKDPQTWLFHRVPSDTDDVVLVADIVIDEFAICRSITSNGFNITISNGKTLTITGVDSTGHPTYDTLLTKMNYYTAGDEPIDASTAADQTILFEYDTLKRIHKRQSIIFYNNLPDTFSTNFHYKNTEILPFLVVNYSNCNTGGCEYDSAFYQYNSDGFITSDSGIQIVNGTNDKVYWSVSRFISENNRIIKYQKRNQYNYYSDGDTTIVSEIIIYDTSFYTQVKMGLNITSQNDTLPLNRKAQHILKYDTKKNPMYKTGERLPVFGFEHFFLEDPQQFNNILEYRQF